MSLNQNIRTTTSELGTMDINKVYFPLHVFHDG